jgi:hypothetical protein
MSSSTVGVDENGYLVVSKLIKAGTCSTAVGTVAKVVSTPDNTSYVPVK